MGYLAKSAKCTPEQKISLKENLVLTTQLLRASRIHRPIFEQFPMDQNAFHKEILSDPFAQKLQVLAAANTDKDLREMLDTVRSVESGIEDLLTSVPIPPLLYEKLLTSPEGGLQFDDRKPEALPSSNVPTLLAMAGETVWRFRLAIVFTLIIAIAADLSIFMPGPTL